MSDSDCKNFFPFLLTLSLVEVAKSPEGKEYNSPIDNH